MDLRKHSAYDDDKNHSSNWRGIFHHALRIYANCFRIYAGESALPIAMDLEITEGTAGQGMTISEYVLF
jgi:hypothetical protein